MITDFHVHSNNSFDSKELLTNMCEGAIKKGITHIAFTEHFSLDENKKSYGCLDYSKYYNEIEQAKHRYKGKLNIAIGLELCEPHLSTKDYELALKEFDLDFTLGSVHNIGSSGLGTLSKLSSSYDAYKYYFKELYKMASYGNFSVAAHLDLINRYASPIHGDYNFNDFQDEIYETLKVLVERGIGIEINTSGLRNSLNNIHPKVEILKRYKELGGEIITIGSDAHTYSDIGYGCTKGLEIVRNLGFKYVFTFNKLKPFAHVIK